MATIPLMFAEEDVENGGKEDNTSGMQNDFSCANNVYNAEISIRMGFLRKVYGLLSMQLLLTMTIAAVFMACEPVKLFVKENPWTILTAFFMTIGILIALHIKRKHHPVNLILLTAFTVIQAYTVGVVVSVYDTVLVLEALIITLSVLVGLTAYTFQSKKDFSFLGIGLFAGLWVLLLGGLFQIFFQSSGLEVLLSIGGAALFCLFIVYDTHMVMRVLSQEEYILATINIYLDIINLFLYILRLLAASRN